MFAKALISGPPLDMPMLVAVDVPNGVLVHDLRQLGWDRFGETPHDQEGEVHITNDCVELRVAGSSMTLDDMRPSSYPGWLQAVDTFGGQVLVAITEHGAADLRGSSTGSQYKELLDSPQSAQAVLPVVHL